MFAQNKSFLAPLSFLFLLTTEKRRPCMQGWVCARCTHAHPHAHFALIFSFGFGFSGERFFLFSKQKKTRKKGHRVKRGGTLFLACVPLCSGERIKEAQQRSKKEKRKTLPQKKNCGVVLPSSSCFFLVHVRFQRRVQWTDSAAPQNTHTTKGGMRFLHAKTKKFKKGDSLRFLR